MSTFSVHFRDADTPVGPARILALNGELDAHTAPEFEAAIQTCLDDGQPRLIVDGSGLDYVSSAGLGVFMAFLETTRQAGGDLKIAALSERVFEVFDLLGFPTLFDFAATVDDAAVQFTS